MQTASVITHGELQSVELPEGFRFNAEEVFVKRLGNSVLLLPKDTNPWDLLIESLDQFTDDFMAVRTQPSQQEREELFE